MKKCPNFLVVRRLQLLLPPLTLAMPMVLLVFLIGRYCTLLKLLNTEGYKKFRWIFRFLYFLKNCNFFAINSLHFIRHWITKQSWDDIFSYFYSLLRMFELYHAPILVQLRVVTNLCSPVVLQLQNRLGPKKKLFTTDFCILVCVQNILVQPNKIFGPIEGRVKSESHKTCYHNFSQFWLFLKYWYISRAPDQTFWAVCNANGISCFSHVHYGLLLASKFKRGYYLVHRLNIKLNHILNTTYLFFNPWFFFLCLETFTLLWLKSTAVKIRLF